MAPNITIPLDALTSRLNLTERFSSVRSQSVASRFANIKPIGEFLNIKLLSKPNNFGEVQSRVNYNLSYYSSNYAVVFVSEYSFRPVSGLRACTEKPAYLNTMSED